MEYFCSPTLALAKRRIQINIFPIYENTFLVLIRNFTKAFLLSTITYFILMEKEKKRSVYSRTSLAQTSLGPWKIV